MTYLIVVQGIRKNTLAKDSRPKINSIDWFAPGQGFFSRPAFFEIAKRFQTAPDQELQLPVPETYLIVVQDVCENALAKDSRPKLNCIDWFASGQGFLVLLVFGGAFFLVFACYLSLILVGESGPSLYIKAIGKTLI